MSLHASDFFDLDQYHKRREHARRAWSDLIQGKRSCITFMNLCAPFLCDLFKVEPFEYYTDLHVMAETQLRGIAWRLDHLDEDEIPLAVFLDQGTVHEAIAFNLPIEYRYGSTPWGGHLLTDILQVDDLEEPDLHLHAGLLKTLGKLEELRSLVKDFPVLTSVHLHAPFTLAAQLFGAQNLIIACYEDPDRVKKLLDFCSNFFLRFENIKWQYGIAPQHLDEFVCWRENQIGLRRLWVSDDTATMLSPSLYRKFALPYNKMLFSNFDYLHLHMDANWNHLIQDVAQLNPSYCEIGGETDWREVVDTLGKTTILQGGILAEKAHSSTPVECINATKAALEAAEGRARIVLTIANEVHPGTPLENLQAILQTVKSLGS